MDDGRQAQACSVVRRGPALVVNHLCWGSVSFMPLCVHCPYHCLVLTGPLVLLVLLDVNTTYCSGQAGCTLV